MPSHADFRHSWLWRHAFVNPFPGVTEVEQAFFRDRYLDMREKAGVLVSQIAAAMPGLTVHDLTHLDALWETASLVSEGAISVNPAEAFVFGASVLLHDSAMSVAAYPQGLEELKQTVAWKDTVVSLLGEGDHDLSMVNDPPAEIVQSAIPEVLRQLHAQKAASLAKQGWVAGNGDTVYLIDDPELRFFYGETIGQIAHSHWWPVSRIEEMLSEDLGAFPARTGSRIDRVKLACLLRIADALHLDQRRAPRFLRALVRPQGISALHWTFQERLAAPHVEHEAVVFTSGAPFEISDADAWWLAYDTISAVNRELQDVDLLVQSRPNSLFFRARRVKGAGSPESLARTVQTQGWRPIDTQLRVSDIAKVVETLGGAKLYGDDPTIVLRELIQNSADAVQARRRHQNRRDNWGTVVVSLDERPDGHWLSVEDNGIGMSERVLTGPLIDFGTSFWRSTLATQEFPGLIANGMNAIGRYGIGFFSVFMLGSTVRVISRRYDQGEEAARILEFRDGTATRPILSPAERGCAPLDGGTRVEVRLKVDPRKKGGLLHEDAFGEKVLTLQQLVGALAPSVGVSLEVEENGKNVPAVGSGDWSQVADDVLLSRLNPLAKSSKGVRQTNLGAHTAIRTLGESDQPQGRAYIWPATYYPSESGWVTIGGLRAARLSNVAGLLLGETVTASRNSAMPLVSAKHLAEWATEQARILAAAKADESFKAKCAEIVLECCGQLEGLPIARWGAYNWINSVEFGQRVAQLRELVVTFEGDFSYDENDDDVLPRDFRNDLELGENVVMVPRHHGSILKIGTKTWPRSITGQPPRSESNLATLVRELLFQAWEGEVQESSENREIGKVDAMSITREMTVFRRIAGATVSSDEDDAF